MTPIKKHISPSSLQRSSYGGPVSSSQHPSSPTSGFSNPKDTMELGSSNGISGSLNEIISQNRGLKQMRFPGSGNSGGTILFGNRTSDAQALGAPRQEKLFSQSTEKSKTYKTEAEAKEAFRNQKEFMLRPDSWNSSGVGLTYADAPTWQRQDSKGNISQKNLRTQKGDFLKIDAPGAQTFYVKVTRAHAGADNAEFTVRPSGAPGSKSTRVDHFFTDQSTRTFSLQRDGKEVRFVTQGRNEVPNAGWTKGGVKAPLNAGNSVGIFAIGELYWNKFADELMKR